MEREGSISTKVFIMKWKVEYKEKLFFFVMVVSGK
jgi:hypothetical protein